MIWYEDRSEPRPVLNMNGMVLTQSCITLAAGMGIQAHKKPLIKNIGTPYMSEAEFNRRVQLEEWYGL